MTRSTIANAYQRGSLSPAQFIAALQQHTASTQAAERHALQAASRATMRRRIDAALYALIPASGLAFIGLTAFIVLTR